MITVEFNSKINKKSESRRFRGMIYYCGKKGDYYINEFIFDNTDDFFHIMDNFKIKEFQKQLFYDDIKELAKDFLIERYVTIIEK